MDSEYRELVNEVLRKTGRNILIFQQIEKGLKRLLPFIYRDDRAKDINSFRKYKKEVKLKTLGHLINKFIESTDYNNDYFVEELRELVAQRNKLIHHFGESKGLNILNTEEGCRTCITELESQYQKAIFFMRIYSCFYLVWLPTFEKITPNLTQA